MLSGDAPADTLSQRLMMKLAFTVRGRCYLTVTIAEPSDLQMGLRE
jgi:hypothetical protein